MGVRAIMKKYNLSYEDRDIINQPEQYAEMVEKSGQALSPCVEVDGVMLSKWIRGLDDIGGKLVQCSTEHDAGEQLMGLGGVVALLRYKMV